MSHVQRIWLFAFLACFAAASSLYADEIEQRSFRASSDGKPTGETQLQVQVKGDGAIVANIRSVRQIKLLGGWLRFGYHGIETWKDGRLQRFDAALDDDGKKRRITATPLEGKLRVTLNDQRHDVRADVWTTSYWSLPANVQREQAVALLDTITGKELSARLQYIGVDRLEAGEQVLTCGHYRLRGAGLEAELWYDGLDRLVRADITDAGRKHSLELTRVTRSNEKANGKRQ